MFFKILYWIVNPASWRQRCLLYACSSLSEYKQGWSHTHWLETQQSGEGLDRLKVEFQPLYFPGPTSSLSSGIQQGRAAGMPLAVTRGQEVIVQQLSPFTSLLINVWLLCLFQMPLGSTTSSFSDTRPSGWAAATEQRPVPWRDVPTVSLSPGTRCCPPLLCVKDTAVHMHFTEEELAIRK